MNKFLDTEGLNILWSKIKKITNKAVTIEDNQTVSGRKYFTNIRSDSTYQQFDNNTIITSSQRALIASPMGKYTWHDQFAFCRHATPKYYTSSDSGTTWEEGELDKKHFSQKDSFYRNVFTDNINAVKWEWNTITFSYGCNAFLNVNFGHVASPPKYTLIFEYQNNNSEWKVLHQHTRVSAVQALLLPLVPYFHESKAYRLTITLDEEYNNTHSLLVGFIRMLSYRMGAQGHGAEYEYPYSWDEDANMYPIVNNTKKLGTTSNKWKEIYATNFIGSLTGVADKAISDSDGNSIKDTYLKKSGLKTINGQSLVGEGDITIQGGGTVDLSEYAKLDSPVFTGNPKAPEFTPYYPSVDDEKIATVGTVYNFLGQLFNIDDLSQNEIKEILQIIEEE